MAYAYFKHDGSVISVSMLQTPYPDETIIEIEVPAFTPANGIYLDLETASVSARQPFIVEVSTNRIAGLPVGTVATLPDGQYTVDDGLLEFEADVPETLWLHLDHPHHIAQYIGVPTGPEAA